MTRKIDGKIFKLASEHLKKGSAMKAAEKLREKGYQARIIKGSYPSKKIKKTVYRVYFN